MHFLPNIKQQKILRGSSIIACIPAQHTSASTKKTWATVENFPLLHLPLSVHIARSTS